MKTYAHYDLEGSIHELVIVKGSQGAGMMLAAKPGVLVGEIDDLKVKVKTERDLEAVREIAQSHRIAATSPRCTLSKKR